MIWKHIKGYEGLYQVSDTGLVKSCVRNCWMERSGKMMNQHFPEKLLSMSLSKQGYVKVHLSKNGKAKHFSLHRLVADAFIDNPENLPEVNHKDGIKTHNWCSNLEWTTKSDNISHSFKLGLRDNQHFLSMNKKGVCNGNAKLNDAMVIRIRDERSTGKTYADLSKDFSIPETTIGYICRGKLWKHVKQ